MPTVGSLFSGIGGFDLGLERAGWNVKWQVEINDYRREVLARHWPDTRRYEDVRELPDETLERVDMVCGGFPCQNLSVAGNRDGLAGSESGLWYDYLRIVETLRPSWVFIENVPGLLSSDEGRDMEIVVGGLTECGYGVSWRVLDSQFFGVPQRRRRVFIIGHIGGPCPPEVLFERDSEEWDSETGEARGEVARTITSRAERYNGEQDTSVWQRTLTGQARSGRGVLNQPYVVNARQDPITPSKPNLDTDGHSWAVRVDNASSNGHGVSRGVSHSLGGATDAVAFAENQQHEVRISDKQFGLNGRGGKAGQGYAGIIETGSAPHDPAGVGEDTGVSRSLDPATVDSKRYAALGDAVTVPVIEWIGRRILEVEKRQNDATGIQEGPPGF